MEKTAISVKSPFVADWVKREKFVAEYCRAGGDRVKAAKAASVGLDTSRIWVAEQWFKDRVDSVKRELDKQMEHRITNILDTTFTAIQNRLDEGDPKVMRDGTIMRVPVAPGLTVLAGVMFDKRAALRRDDNPDNSNVASSLEKIADKLRQYEATGNSAALRDATVIDVDAKETPPADGSDLY